MKLLIHSSTSTVPLVSAQTPTSVMVVPGGTIRDGSQKIGPTVRCKRWTELVKSLDGRSMIDVTMGKVKLDVVPSFGYLGDCVSSVGGCEFASNIRCRVELLYILISGSFPITARCILYNWVRQGLNSTCNGSLGPNLTWSASPATQWAG